MMLRKDMMARDRYGSMSRTDDMRSGYPKSDLTDAKPGAPYTFSAWGKSSSVDGSHASAISTSHRYNLSFFEPLQP